MKKKGKGKTKEISNHRDSTCIRYWVGRDVYETEPFSPRKLVRLTMEEMPVLRSLNVLNMEMMEVTDAYTKKEFEENVLEKVNRYAVKGSITRQTIHPQSQVNWRRLIGIINTLFYELKSDESRYWWRIIRGYRVKIDKESPEALVKECTINDNMRNRAHIAKSNDRELFYERECGIKPTFVEENQKYMRMIDKKLLEEGDSPPPKGDAI